MSTQKSKAVKPRIEQCVLCNSGARLECDAEFAWVRCPTCDNEGGGYSKKGKPDIPKAVLVWNTRLRAAWPPKSKSEMRRLAMQAPENLAAEFWELRDRLAKLEAVASAAASLMSEDGAREAMSQYNVLFILADRLAALDAKEET